MTGAGEIQEAVAEIKAADDAKPRAGRDPVNQPMINNWVEAIGDRNPIYVDEAAARAAGHPGIVAPPAMIQVWTMFGLAGERPTDDPMGPDHQAVRRRRLYRRGRHQLRADLPPVSAAR